MATLNSTYTATSEIIQYALVPLLCFVGIYGNIMAFALISANHMLRNLPSNRILVALSICSSLFLVNLFATWLQSSLGLATLNASSEACKTFTYLTSVWDFAAVWLIVCLSFERLLVIVERVNYHHWLSKGAVIVSVILVVLTFSCLLNFPLLLMVDLKIVPEVKGGQTCDVVPAYEDLYVYFAFSEIFLSCFLPTSLIFGCNAAVVSKLLTMKRFACGSASTGRSAQCVKETPLSPYRGESTTNEHGLAPVGSYVTRQSYTLTWSLLTTSSLFVLLNLPSYVYRLEVSIAGPPSTVAGQVAELVCYLLYYSHHALVFYLYVFHSPAMRRKLIPTCCNVLTCDCCGIFPELDDVS